VNIGVLLDGQTRGAGRALKVVQDEVLSLTREEFSVSFPESARVVADFTPATIKAAAERLLQDPRVDLVIGVGPLSANFLARRPTLPKPVIVLPVFDPVAQGIPFKDGRSGVKNLAYLTTPQSFDRSVQGFRRVVPFKKLAVLVDRSYVETFPQVGQATARRFAKQGVQLTFVAVPRGQGAALPSIPRDCDAALLLLRRRDDDATLDRVIKLLLSRKLPSFTIVAGDLVQRGVMAGYAAAENLQRRARRIALNVQRILLGQDAGKLEVVITDGPPQLTINMQVARVVGFRPTWDLLSEARLIGRKRPAKIRRLTMARAVEEALAANLSLLARHKNVEAGIYEVRKAYARYLPSIRGGFTGSFIDGDRANASFGSYERALSVNVGASQLLFNEGALANITIEKQVQRAREQDLEQLKLDVMAGTAVAYLNVLKAKVFERIQKKNLEVTKKNLELARVRQAVGASTAADVYRWEAQLAADKRSVIRAVADRNKAEIALNELRQRPLEEPFTLAEAETPGDSGLQPGQLIAPYARDPWAFASMREFMVQEAMRDSPELKQLDRNIDAQKRFLLSTRLDFGLPTLSLQFGLDHFLATSGEPLDTSGLPPPFDQMFTQPDKTAWSVGLAASWSLLEGGERYHRSFQAAVNLDKLNRQREALALQLEQRVRVVMHQAGASFPGIALSKAAAEAAEKSLELVTEAYSRGTANIIVLLDAQNAALGSELSAAVALYDFNIDFINAQRAIANKEFFTFSDSERRAWYQRLGRHLKQSAQSGE
jgi:outer membrane protein TolC